MQDYEGPGHVTQAARNRAGVLLVPQTLNKGHVLTYGVSNRTKASDPNSPPLYGVKTSPRAKDCSKPAAGKAAETKAPGSLLGTGLHVAWLSNTGYKGKESSSRTQTVSRTCGG